MYTHIRHINHSLNYMRYMRGETSYKEHPEKIVEIDMSTAAGIRYTLNRYMEMRLDCKYGNPYLMGSTVQFTLSPVKEDTISYKGEDWKNLWMTFLEELDKIDTVPIKNDEGVVVDQKVEKTHFRECNQLVCLHMESKSRIPHIHTAVCPVDRNGRTYGLDYLRERGRIAAKEVCRRLGLTDSSDENVNNLSSAYHTCLDVILEMTQAWSWKQFKKGVRERGYTILEKRDNNGQVLDWAMRKGDKVFRGSDLGDNFCIENIYHLWHNLIEPYNNPVDILSSEEILEEIRLRGWYDRFLNGEFRDQMEASLYVMLEQKLVMEQEQLDFEEMIYGEDFPGLSEEDQEEDMDNTEDKDLQDDPILEQDRFPADELSRKILKLYYNSVDKYVITDSGTNADDTSFVDYDDFEEDFLIPQTTEEIEELKDPSSPIKTVNLKKKQSKVSGTCSGLSDKTEHPNASEEVDTIIENQSPKEGLHDLKI